VVDAIAARCTESSAGARNVEKILSRTLLPELSGEVLSKLAAGAVIEKVRIGVDGNGLFSYGLG
jgi:type VI secretion system protein VasG